MIKQRLHKYKEELKDEALRIRNRLKEELLEPDNDTKKDDKKFVPN
jgi:hypothetical protein